VRLTGDEDGGEALVREVFAAGVARAGDGGDPVLREMGVGGDGGGIGEAVEFGTALVGAPNAVGREEENFASVVHEREAFNLGREARWRSQPMSRTMPPQKTKQRRPTRSFGIRARAVMKAP
jgi:hypothetical protein